MTISLSFSYHFFGIRHSKKKIFNQNKTLLYPNEVCYKEIQLHWIILHGDGEFSKDMIFIIYL